MAKRNDIGGNPTVDVLVNEMNAIATKDRRRVKAGDDTVRAVQIARIIRRMTLGSETRERLRPPFQAMVERLGGVKNNKRFTTSQRAELYGAGRQALAKLPAPSRTESTANASASSQM